MVDFYWIAKNFVAGVGAADADEKIVFRRDMTNDVSLALATVLAAH